MTSRIPYWREGKPDGSVSVSPSKDQTAEGSRLRTGDEQVGGSMFVQPVPVTEKMIDEAVDRVVSQKELSPDTAEVLKSTLGRDTNGGLLHAYYSSKAAVTRAAVTGVVRKDLTISYVLGDDDVLALTEYAPEFRLRFHNRDSHDHAMAAVTRIIDHKLIASRLPVSVPMSDVGGDPLTHIKAEATKVHVCGPVADVKDPMRHKLRRMAATRIASELGNSVQAGLAQAYLDQRESFTCSRMAQRCTYRTPIITAVHVYDVPMEDWPKIMENKGASVVEGCLLFSDRFFSESSGQLGVSKARYEIDVAADKFRMGFANSPAWWYEHKFSQYVLYGTDQLMACGSQMFSYKVIEKRGDTLFYRILRLAENSYRVSRHLAYRSPSVSMVSVNGFELKEGVIRSGLPLSRKTYLFPKNLWSEMVSQASEDFERGVMDYGKMYNHYRTVSVRHTINAVLVMGGEQVSADELVPLVVHSCLAAAAQSLLGQRETRGITAAAMSSRRVNMGILKRAGEAVSVMVKALVGAVSLPFRGLADKMKTWHVSQVEQWMLSWEPESEIVSVEVATLFPGWFTRMKAMVSPAQPVKSADQMIKEAALDMAPFDHFSAVVANPDLVSVLGRVCPQVEMPASTVSPGVVGRTESLPSYVTVEAKPQERAVDVSAARVAAIREHMEETRLQNRATSFACAVAYRELSARGEPSRASLIRMAELHRNPDFWRVESGVIVESALGLDPEKFIHSAVYYPVPDSGTGEVIRAVHSGDWTGEKFPGGPEVTHKNFVLSDTEFSGWVLVTDDLLVHNGPEIVSSMEKALALPHDYGVDLQWGPPGCGKTFAIKSMVVPDGTDAVMCPVRESIEDTRQELVIKYPEFPKPRRYMRTVDSYLVNHGADSSTRSLKVDRLLADECYMAHAGKWYAAAALLGVKSVVVFGDDEQIPHIPRVQAPKLHVKIKADQRHDSWITYRCPASSVAAWGSVYDWRVRTKSGNGVGEMVEVRETRGRAIPEGCVMMCMYQADKKEIRKLYSADLKRIKIITAHEAEGKTYSHVWLHRFDNRKRNDKFSLYDQQPHVLVAMSRHTHSFVYRCPGDLGDLVSAWVARAGDPRRLAAAQSVETAGQSVEKL